jgi:hypothetical protein
LGRAWGLPALTVAPTLLSSRPCALPQPTPCPEGLAVSIAAAKFSLDANNIARSHNKIEAETALTGSSDSLQKRFKESGIDDTPVLANFFLQLESNHREGIISDSFYDQQIMSWCPITRQAHDKVSAMPVSIAAALLVHKADDPIGWEGAPRM